MKMLIENGYVAIDKQSNEKLIEQMRMAKTTDDGRLDKSEHSLDLIDALMLNL